MGTASSGNGGIWEGRNQLAGAAAVGVDRCLAATMRGTEHGEDEMLALVGRPSGNKLRNAAMAAARTQALHAAASRAAAADAFALFNFGEPLSAAALWRVVRCCVLACVGEDVWAAMVAQVRQIQNCVANLQPKHGRENTEAYLSVLLLAGHCSCAHLQLEYLLQDSQPVDCSGAAVSGSCNAPCIL